jgi:hypothetical protein
MNLLEELNTGKKLRRKGWREHKNQETLYISKVNTKQGDVVAVWTNNCSYSKYAAIAHNDDGYWAVEFLTLAYEIFENDWEVVE